MAAFDWHGAPVGFKEKVCPFVVANLIWKFQGKNPIRNNPQFYALGYIYPPLERLAFAWAAKFIFGNESNATVTAGKFNGYHDV